MRAPFLAIPLVILAAACGGSDSSGPSTQPNNPTPAVVATVSVTGASSIDVGKTIQLSASARDASGATIAGKTFAWSSSNDAVASVASDGTVSGKSAGTATITASVDGKSGSSAVTVSAPAPAVASVSIAGASTLEAGTTTQLTATVKDASGAAITTVPVTWSSSDGSLMSVSSTGLVNAAHIATVTITATAGGKSATLDVTSNLTPYTFNFPAGTTTADAQRIKDAVQSAHAFFLKAFGRTITKPTTVTGATTIAGCDSRSGNAAFTQPQSVIFCVANQGWTANGPIARQKIAMHELFHVWQYEYKWLGLGHDGAAWITEGSAELVGWMAADAAGLMPIATSRGCQVKEASDFNTRNPPGEPALSSVESVQAFQSFQGPLYPWAMTAMDELTTSAGGLASLKTYGDAVAANNSPTGWTTAFQTAFGQSTSAFYAQYQAYFNSLPVPPSYLCGV
jgi:hypothetical protein